MDPHTARPTNSSATKKTNGQHAIAQAFPFCHALVHPGLTCVMHAACYLAFLYPVLGNNRICEFQESLQWAFMLTARDCQRERFLPTLILEKHLHREVTENKTQLHVWGFFFSWVIPSQEQSAYPFLYSAGSFPPKSLPLEERLHPPRGKTRLGRCNPWCRITADIFTAILTHHPLGTAQINDMRRMVLESCCRHLEPSAVPQVWCHAEKEGKRPKSVTCMDVAGQLQ